MDQEEGYGSFSAGRTWLSAYGAAQAMQHIQHQQAFMLLLMKNSAGVSASASSRSESARRTEGRDDR